MSANQALIVIWVAYTACWLSGVVVVLFWAVRTRQFSEPDRARFLALRSAIPPEPPGGPPCST